MSICRRPQRRLPAPQPERQTDMTHVKTSTGFEVDVEEKNLDDMEFVDALIALESGDLTGYGTVSSKLLSQEDKQKLYDHVRTDGRVPIKSFVDELAEIIKGLQSQKK